jgi:hypothetical protein
VDEIIFKLKHCVTTAPEPHTSPCLWGWQQRPIEIHAKFSRQMKAIDRIINTVITLINHLSNQKKKQHVIINVNDSDAKTQHLERLHPFILDLHNLLQLYALKRQCYYD